MDLKLAQARSFLESYKSSSSSFQADWKVILLALKTCSYKKCETKHNKKKSQLKTGDITGIFPVLAGSCDMLGSAARKKNV